MHAYKQKVYTVLGPFGGGGFGLHGFAAAEITMLGRRARFEVIGGIDFDAEACRDFELMTGVQEWNADVEKITVAEIRKRWPKRPDCVFMSPPCKGASKLLSNAKAKEAKYAAMNRLAIVWTGKMLEAWADNLPPLVLFENVPNIVTRSPETIEGVRRLLKAAGYVTHDGFHCCGEIGGLAQYRKRFLMVARHPKKVPPLLYQPPKKRVRGCGEVLGALPMPEDPAGGAMHKMPKISWLNWIRLALIPAGGDWRDLPGVLEAGQARRTVFRRHHMQRWTDPTSTIGGSGSNGPTSVADPRVKGSPFHHTLKVTPWDKPAPSVTSSPAPSSGAVSVADPRGVDVSLSDKPNRHYCQYTVRGWDQPTKTLTSASRPGSGAQAVADPRPGWFRGVLGVTPWTEPVGVVASSSRPGNGNFSVADPRVKAAYDNGYAVLGWEDPSPTVAGGSHPGQGAYSVADPRMRCQPRAGSYGVLDHREPSKTVTGSHRVDNAPAAIADPRWPEPDEEVEIGDPRKAPPTPPVIIADDGTWHRPLTTLELAALQSIPTTLNGSPLVLTGSGSTKWRETIGNAVPPLAAKAIAEQMLVSLISADAQAFMLSSGGQVWVDAPDALEPGWARLQ